MKNKIKEIVRRCGFWVLVLPTIITLGIVERPFERNYYIDDPEGLGRIIARAQELAGQDSIFDLDIQTGYERRDMDYLILSTVNLQSGVRRKIQLDRTHFWRDYIDTTFIYGKDTMSYFDVRRLTDVLPLIEKCRKLIPHGYSYKHTERVTVYKGRIDHIRIAVRFDDEGNAEPSKFVGIQKYQKVFKSRRGRGTSTSNYEYPVMEFVFGEEDGDIFIL